MGIIRKSAKAYSEENECIRQYFRECLPAINDSNLYMLRKACMYISQVYIFMLIVARLLLKEFHISIAYILVVPLIIIYFQVNLYTIRHRGEIGTGMTAAICCTFYFFLAMDLAIIDVFGTPAGQALWLPIGVMALPMIFIDRLYKYGFEEFIVLSIMLVMSYFQKEHDVFIRDVYIAIAAYVISMLSARIILEMRSKEALASEEVKRLSALDKLTHVLNKGALIQSIEKYYSTKPVSESCAMCIIDLDDFKLVNDNLGHNVGDILLEKVGSILGDNFRAYDIVGRYGGDEFLVVMPKMEDPKILESRCKTLQMFINDFDLGSGHKVSASIGAVITGGKVTADEAFNMADDALYKSKIQGKNCCTIWIRDERSIEQPILMVMSSVEHDGMEELRQGEGDKFNIIRAENDDDAIRNLSEYRSNLKIILVELNAQTGLGVLTLKYLKSREAFTGIPVLAVVNNSKNRKLAEELNADGMVDMGAEDAVFSQTIRKLLK